MEPIVLSILGQPPRKSNDRRIVTTRSGQRRVIKSAKALAWVKAAGLQIPQASRVGVGGPKQPLRILFFVRYASRRPDLSVELILDTLQKYGVIKDDRYVFEVLMYKLIDKESPGVDIVITETQERTLTMEQRKQLAFETEAVGHALLSLEGPFDDKSVLTHWSDGEWFLLLSDGDTTSYSYDHEGRNPELTTALLRKKGRIGGTWLTPDTALEIRRLYDNGELSVAQIAAQCGTSRRNVGRIGRRETWRDLPEKRD